MAFIKAQKLVRDENATIVSGSASILDTEYDKFGRYHARHTVREKLGKVIYLSDDKKTGIFLSSTRGLVEYDATTDAFNAVERGDPRLSMSNAFPEAAAHTVFGDNLDSWMLLKFLEKSGLLPILRSAFSKKMERERVLCHVLHGILKDGSRISCDNFMAKSFASYVLADVPVSSLRSDRNSLP